MTIIAVAGGTGKLGRAIVEALRDTTSHSVYILTRKADDDQAKELGIPLLLADYSDVESLANVLESNKINTVVSAISVIDDATSTAQLNLIEAAERSSSTKRFIPSEYGIRHAGLFPTIKGKLAAAARLRSTTSLEYTFVSNGFFLDFFGMPRVKTYLDHQLVFAVDVANNVAAIPGSGDVPIVFTHTFDVKGVKFNITHDSEEMLKSSKITELPSHSASYSFLPKEKLQAILSAFGRWTIAGDFDMPEEGSLNQRFPEIKPRNVRDVLEEGWKA
ncbi:hypothetical protein BDW75DRAFT_234693 [Aspergillus navahoensis]